MTFAASFGHRLRVTRIALGLTEKETAAAHKVTLATYRGWEAGGRTYAPESCVDFAKRFDVSLDWLVCGEADRVKRHLQLGKVAILQVSSRVSRERKAKYANAPWGS